jgi:hypothetical protein
MLGWLGAGDAHHNFLVHLITPLVRTSKILAALVAALVAIITALIIVQVCLSALIDTSRRLLFLYHYNPLRAVYSLDKLEFCRRGGSRDQRQLPSEQRRQLRVLLGLALLQQPPDAVQLLGRELDSYGAIAYPCRP